MTDVSGTSARTVAAALIDGGHVVRSCRDSLMPDAPACAALRDVDCPLDRYPIDVAVEVPPAPTAGDLAGAGLCAARRRVPLILVDRPDDPLGRWAAASVQPSGVAAALNALETAELPLHTAEARRTVRDELTRRGNGDVAADVVVHRRNGGLAVHLSLGASFDQQEAERLAVHVVQRIRAFDPWARTVDVSAETIE